MVISKKLSLITIGILISILLISLLIDQPISHYFMNQNSIFGTLFQNYGLFPPTLILIISTVILNYYIFKTFKNKLAKAIIIRIIKEIKKLIPKDKAFPAFPSLFAIPIGLWFLMFSDVDNIYWAVSDTNSLVFINVKIKDKIKVNVFANLFWNEFFYFFDYHYNYHYYLLSVLVKTYK